VNGAVPCVTFTDAVPFCAPLQVTLVFEMLHEIVSDWSIITIVSVAVQPFASVATIEYVPEHKAERFEFVLPLFHK
jgi:hypothetical protein